ncbi:MAG TPA: HAD-IIIA family hydrolase [Desulfohalobiaceae bacterium]|nr:HAD-IIIA family hydrolase [Desulfohalobiaceae bacterium]
MSLNIRNIIFDRDGTIIEDLHYISRPEQVYLLPNVGPILQNLQSRGYRLFLVTNQSGITRGYCTEQDYQNVNNRLYELLLYFQVQLKDEIHCPHSPEDNCSCRKPLPGMWQKLSCRQGIKAEETIMIGDKMSDIGFAHLAKLSASILVLTGCGQNEAYNSGLPDKTPNWQIIDRKRIPWAPDLISANLRWAYEWIIAQQSEISDSYQN